ncbi:MAG: xylulokinase [Pseudomonadota bacterium]
MYIGLDLGTSGLKGVLVDGDQRIVAETSAPLTVSRPHPGWSEQAPSDWIAAAESVMASLANLHSLSGVTAIGLSGQMHGAVCLDAEHQVLRPAILWNDTRAAEEAATLDADPTWRAISGNIVFPGFTAPKISWMQAHEPDLASRIATVLLPKDFLRFWLTGDMVSDVSDAAGTAWLDTGARAWSVELLRSGGLDTSAMPALVEGSAVSGHLSSSLARKWGLPDGVVVAGGGGDNAASAVGVGVVEPGTAFVSLGTSGVLFASTHEYSPDPGTSVHTFCHALPGLWCQMGVILAATDALSWFARLAGSEPAALTAELGQLQRPGETLFLPYLGGERTPHNDAAVRGAFTGLSHASDRSAVTRAVLEGVTFAFRDCYDALTATGTRIERLVAVGGGSRSRYWIECLATALGHEIEIPVDGDFGGAFGAARLAMMAAGGGGAELATMPPIANRVAPVAGMGPAFFDAQERYRATYRALKTVD